MNEVSVIGTILNH